MVAFETRALEVFGHTKMFRYPGLAPTALMNQYPIFPLLDGIPGL